MGDRNSVRVKYYAAGFALIRPTPRSITNLDPGIFHPLLVECLPKFLSTRHPSFHRPCSGVEGVLGPLVGVTQLLRSLGVIILAAGSIGHIVAIVLDMDQTG